MKIAAHKYLLLIAGAFFFYTSATCQVIFKIGRSADYTITYQVKNMSFEINQDGQIVTVKDNEGNEIFNQGMSLIDGSHDIKFWPSDWNCKKDKLMSIDGVGIDYWSEGWEEKTGKVMVIDGIQIDYWSPGWEAKTGKLMMIGKVAIDYWSPGWGPSTGKIKTIGKISVDYWSQGWGAKEGAVKVINGKDPEIKILAAIVS
jgi:hypothetical protein